MTVDLPPSPAPAPSGQPDAEGALTQSVFGGLDAIRAARLAASAFEPLDLRCARAELNDSGNATRLRERYGDRLLYVPDIGWHYWRKNHWSQRGAEEEAHKIADLVQRAIFNEARGIADLGAHPGELADDFNKRVRNHLSWAIQTGNVQKSQAMLKKAAPYLAQQVSDLDPDIFLFNCDNCTLDLSNASDIKRRRHNPKDLITRVSPVKYDPKAQCPAFTAFLDRILPDRAVQVFLQQWAGISLTGDTSVQSLLLMHGTGANGKSTLDEALRYILGDYAKTVAFASLLRDDKKSGSAATPDLARLRGARAAFASEPEHSVQFSEGLIKQMTGGEPITARYLNKEFFEYLPRFKLWLAFNVKPTVRGTDNGIWRRLKLVPFNVTIPTEERDPHLIEKLKAEASGILNWMLDGFRHWRDCGLIVPDAVTAATQEYRDESDVIGRFLEEETERGDGFRVQSTVLHVAYEAWSRANHLRKPFGLKNFSQRVSQSFEKEKFGTVFFLGLRLRDRQNVSQPDSAATDTSGDAEDI